MLKARKLEEIVIYYNNTFIYNSNNSVNNDNTDRDEDYIGFMHKIKIILIVIIIILMLFILISSIYYRYYLKKFGIEPFGIPSICPEFLFPRKEYDPLLRKTVDRNLEMIFD